MRSPPAFLSKICLIALTAGAFACATPSSNLAPPSPEASPGSLLTLAFPDSEVRSFVLAGFLKESHAQGIKFEQILTSRLASIIAALFYSSRSPNDFDWKLNQLKNEFLEEDESLIRNLFKGRRQQRFSQWIDQEFRGKKIESLPVKFCILVLDEPARTHDFRCQGDLAEVLSQSLSGLPYPADSNLVRASASRRGVYVNPLSVKDRALENLFGVRVLQFHERVLSLFSSAPGGPLLIEPVLESLGFQDFRARAEMVFRGTILVKENLDKLKLIQN